MLLLSFGGFVAHDYAVRHPDRLYKLILASTVARMLPRRVFDPVAPRVAMDELAARIPDAVK